MSRKRGRKEEAAAPVDEPDAAQVEEVEAEAQDDPMEQEEQAPEAAPARDRRAVMADVARRRAAHFAHFQDEDAEEDGNNVHAGGSNARTLGPWSSAVELVNAREQAAAARQDKILIASRAKAKADQDSGWDPSRDPSLGPRPTARVASLFSVCLELLVEHIEAVVSLWGLPDSMRTALAAGVCAKRKMSAEVAQLFADGAPAELLMPDCTQLDSEAMGQLLSSCCSKRLEVLELGSCGRGFGDEAARLVANAGPLPALASLRLQGAYRLTDSALEALLSVTGPSLKRLAAPQCSRLTGKALGRLPALAPALRSLDVSDCRGVDVALLCAAVPQLMGLQQLALDGLAEVDDAALQAIARAPALRELSLAHCTALTDAGIAALAATRPLLESLCIDECTKLGDAAVNAVADGCKGLRSLSVRRCAKLSDAALAEVAGRGALRRLVVAGVAGVGNGTMRALASACKDTLEELDVSFCRNVPERSLGLVADRCTHLRSLKVYGCSQLTGLFVHGHSSEALEDVKGLGPLETYTVSAQA